MEAGESEGIVTDERCDFCQHDHSDQSQEPDELTPFRPGHSDICDCARPDDEHRDYLTDRAEGIAMWNSR